MIYFRELILSNITCMWYLKKERKEMDIYNDNKPLNFDSRTEFIKL